MWIGAILIGLVVGVFRGGRISNLKNLRFKHINLFLTALLIQLAPFFLHFIPLIKRNALIISFAGYALVLIFMALNYSKKGMPFIITAAAMNTLVMALNNFKMPVYFASKSAAASQLKIEILSGDILNYTVVDKLEGIFAYLGKFIPMPSFYPGLPLIGIADILIALGVIILIQNEICYRRGFFV